jgi:hypothetical protein
MITDLSPRVDPAASATLTAQGIDDPEPERGRLTLRAASKFGAARVARRELAPLGGSRLTSAALGVQSAAGVAGPLP